MRLDDIGLADAGQPDPGALLLQLKKIGVIRRIAGKLITFLAQLENFQKKLWLKKKFVLETDYCMTLDRIPEGIRDELYPEIAANRSQHEEWIELFAIDEIAKTPTSPGYTKKLSVEFLKANDKLVLDTKHFDAGFKARLVASINDFDERYDGLLVHSENFQALNLLAERYREQVQCVYIDPPYNSPSSEIMYKNSYKHSSWLSLMHGRLRHSKFFQRKDGSCVVAIDENESIGLQYLMREIFADYDVTVVSIEHNKKGIQGDHFSYSSEYAVFAVPFALKNLNRIPLPREQWEYSNLRNWGDESSRGDARNCFYPIYVKNGVIVGFGDVSDDDYHPGSANVVKKDRIEVYPVDDRGTERKWRYARDSVESIIELLDVRENDGVLSVFKAKPDMQFKTMWYDKKYNAGDNGKKLLTKMGFEKKLFDFPKSLYTVKDCIFAVSDRSSTVLDYFAGSGTTGHAVIDLNRDDREEGRRKYVLIEMGNHFKTVLMPRMKKVVYSVQWRNGKPVDRNGISHCFKYIRLESYEDTLNNLRFDEKPAKSKLLDKKKNPALHADYLLNYMLDVETRGSDSLLNFDAFAEPDRYMLKVKQPGSDECVRQPIDLLETFNYLIGLRVDQIRAPRRFNAKFKRIEDPEVPEDQEKKTVLAGKLQESGDGVWSFRAVNGWVPKNPSAPNDGGRENVLVVWRNLTDDIVKDNLVLDEWLRNSGISPRDFDILYVNGGNNLPNAIQIEKEFADRMWDIETK